MPKQELEEVNLLCDGSLYTFSFPSGSTVGDLRSQIFNQLQILPENQDLEFNHSSISGDQLKLAGLSEKMPILITVEITEERGFQFNNLKQKQKRNVVVSTKLRDPRIVLPGLILKAKCKKQGCDAYNKEVNINKGFGKFELGRMLSNNLCPLCSQRTTRVYNFGYYQTNILINGCSQQSQDFKLQDIADDDTFHTFKEDNGVQKWDYLDITTSALKK